MKRTPLYRWFVTDPWTGARSRTSWRMCGDGALARHFGAEDASPPSYPVSCANQTSGDTSVGKEKGRGRGPCWVGNWWSWRESNPRPKAIAGQVYTLSWLIWF
jgi:hypothetical protein